MSCMFSKHHFPRHGSSPKEPYQPQFTCTSCHRAVKSFEMYSLVHCKAQATQPAPDTDKIDIPDEAPTSSHNQQDYIQPLCQTVERLTSELLQARLEIKILQARLDHLPPTPPDHLSSQNFPTLQESQTRSTAFLDAPWNNPAKLQAIKQPSLQQREQRRQQREAAAARFFNLPRQIKVLHTYIHYPARNTAAILIHNDYKEEFTTILKHRNVSLKNDFNPSSGDILADPKYSHLTPSERDIIASEIQQTRLERALQHIRPPVKFAVARLFLEKQWISKSAFDALSTERTQPQIASIFKQNTAPATQATFFTNTDTDNDSIMRYQRDDPIQNLSSSGATTSPRL
ncbi:hypothetical protein G6F46_011472 [Rhizopus delemar]|uniref:Uncharacterized protein n=2 Tax=Rhizopus TaxID=4842 RepID=A0A9P6YTF0_9FUNG|nr:hypothetical protein G6F55_011027 [Rhizopus delemar]KAG1535351.1 hypothetical protein G6F51_011584 [Rhizopus arrhizus]KAG1489865.1 hypothetical protein G6F54_011136 [Rhizopus delemar]KAG1514436.1 hypothetical protein G6F52_009923 [Rhizopus delemar]KAG1541406.1 hypothetical protein G6F49_011893 [Rhizopus delemar]